MTEWRSGERLSAACPFFFLVDRIAAGTTRTAAARPGSIWPGLRLALIGAALLVGCASDATTNSADGGQTGAGGGWPSESGGGPGTGGMAMGGATTFDGNGRGGLGTTGGTGLNGGTAPVVGNGGQAVSGEKGTTGGIAETGGGPERGGAVGTGGIMSTGGAAAAGGTSAAGGNNEVKVPIDAALLSRCTGSPIRCTIPVASDGNYNVTVELGDANVASTSRTLAELYRIVVPPLSLAAGQLVQRTFSVNVRAEKHDGYSATGMVLDLLIDGAAPRLHGVGVVSVPSMPTIFVAGDSTSCDWDPALANILDPSERGWAQELSQYLLPGVAVANYADSGETAGSFYTKFFPAARAAFKSGDTLFIQFGHNDQKSDTGNYKTNLMKYISDARAKGVTPVLFTPVARKSATSAAPGFAGLDQQARDLAAAENVQLVDLTSLSIDYYKTVSNLSSLFATPSEGTHFGETGATQIAGLVASAIKKSPLSIAAFVR